MCLGIKKLLHCHTLIGKNGILIWYTCSIPYVKEKHGKQFPVYSKNV